MKGGFGWNATKTYNGWEFNRPQEPLMSEKTPRLRPVERVNRQPLNADQQRRLGQLSFSGSNDIGSGKPFPGVARELESPFGVSGLIEDPRDLAEHMESIDNSSEV